MTRVVVTGATGNAGTSVLRALSADPAVDAVVHLAWLIQPSRSRDKSDVERRRRRCCGAG